MRSCSQPASNETVIQDSEGIVIRMRLFFSYFDGNTVECIIIAFFFLLAKELHRPQFSMYLSIQKMEMVDKSLYKDLRVLCLSWICAKKEENC